MHLTEWSDYRAIDPAALAGVVARRVIIDARCCLDTELWSKAGWSVHVLGRPEAGSGGIYPPKGARGVRGEGSPREQGAPGDRPPG